MIAGIYLAAGASSRMNRPKLNLPIGGSALGGLALQAALASRLDHVVIVTRREDSLSWLPPDIGDNDDSGRNPNNRFTSKGRKAGKWTQAPCDSAELGIAESLKTGLRAAESLLADAVMVLLADQPFVGVPLIDRLIEAYREDARPFIAAGHAGIARPPVLFDRAMFPQLYRLEGDVGARRLIQADAGLNGAVVEWNDHRCFADVDTQDHYEAIICDEEAMKWKATRSYLQRI